MVKHISVSHSTKVYSGARALECKPQEMTSREAILALDVFKDLGILKEEALDDGRHVYRWVNVQQKLELHTSLTFMTYSQEGS